MDPTIDPSIHEGTLPLDLERPAIAAHACQADFGMQLTITDAAMARCHVEFVQSKSGADARIPCLPASQAEPKALRHTMRFESISKALAKRALKHIIILW